MTDEQPQNPALFSSLQSQPVQWVPFRSLDVAPDANNKSAKLKRRTAARYEKVGLTREAGVAVPPPASSSVANRV